MSDTTDLMIALRDLGLVSPASGDAGDARCRAVLMRELASRRSTRRRVRIPFGAGRITLAHAGILATLATTTVAATLALVNASPTALFANNPQRNTGFGGHQTVIPSTVRKLTTVNVPGFGALQYWIADTQQHGICWGMRDANGSWLALGHNGVGGVPVLASGGIAPGCGPTRKQVVLAQGNSHVGLLPTSVDYQDNQVKNSKSQSWDIYFGTVNANNAAAVRDETTRKTAKLIDGRYFILLEPVTANPIGGDNLRAINAAGKPLPANYGPKQYRNH
jgi:hypothetical protein